MYDELEARQLCIRAINRFVNSFDASIQDKADTKEILTLLRNNKSPAKITGNILCNALASYLKSLKTIEGFIISDKAFQGFDGMNPLLVTLNKEINLTLETKAQICHENTPKPRTRIDW